MPESPDAERCLSYNNVSFICIVVINIRIEIKNVKNAFFIK